MAIVKFITAGCPVNNIFPYVTDKEKTDDKLISGIDCLPESALAEFQCVKRQFHNENGRQYYHIIQSFAPEDDVNPETAHQIGIEFAEYFPGFQMLIATHVNKSHTHNHIIMNSVNFKNGKKFHQSRDEMLEAKAYSNKICQAYGLSTTEEKCTFEKTATWKWKLIGYIEWAMAQSVTKDDFIQYMGNHGYHVKWEDNYKYITFTTPENIKCRDNKLFDERFLKDNLEIYFSLGGGNSYLAYNYQDYKTPSPPENANMTTSFGLFEMLKTTLEMFPPEAVEDCTCNDFLWHSKKELEKLEAMGIHARRETFKYYAWDEEDEQTQGLYL